MSEWLVEEGIAEQRAILVEGHQILAARLHWPGGHTAGRIDDAVLVAKQRGATRGTVRFPDGEEALIDGLLPAITEGSTLRCQITRPPLAEQGRYKLAHCRLSDAPPRPAPGLVEQLRSEGHALRIVQRFPDSLWDELWLEAFDGQVDLAGGTLQVIDTPAMTLIDVDGIGAPQDLALAAAPAIAAVLTRFDIGGNIGVDFPTVASKADRRRVDEALRDALGCWPHECTAMNGFGFVQIVARFSRPSLLQLVQRHRASAAARRMLRQAEQLTGHGTLSLVMNPAVHAALRDEWCSALGRRCGRAIRLTSNPALAMESGLAQIVQHG